jgi:hypothetical protein
MVIGPQGSCDLWSQGDAIESPVVAGQDDLAPVLRDVQLAGCSLPGARKLDLSDTIRAVATRLAWAANHTALSYAIDRPAGRVFVLSGDLEAAEFAKQGVWPILLANALDWVAADRSKTGLNANEGVAHLPDWQESDLSTPGGAATDDTSSSGAIVPAGVPLWTCLVAAALVLLAAEWCWFQRRWTC